MLLDSIAGALLQSFRVPATQSVGGNVPSGTWSDEAVTAFNHDQGPLASLLESRTC